MIFKNKMFNLEYFSINLTVLLMYCFLTVGHRLPCGISVVDYDHHLKKMK